MTKHIKTYFAIFLLHLFHFSYSQSQIGSIPKLKIWLRADTLVTQSSGLISDWGDVSTNNYHFSESNSIVQPTLLNSSILNGMPTIYFNGLNQLQSLVNFSFSNCSIFCVASQNSGDNAYGRLLDQNVVNGFWLGRSSNNNQFGGGFFENNVPYGNFENIGNDTPFVFSMIRQNNIVSYFLNHSAFTVPTRTTLSGATNNTPLSIGAALGGSANGKKNIYEIIIFDTIVSAANKIIIEQYLNDKYAPPITLPDDITVNNLCDTVLTPINPNNNSYSYLWSTGQTIPSITVNTPGKYWVRATNIFGKTSSDTINVIYPGNYLSNLSFCQSASIDWNTQLPKNQFSFLWNDNSTDSVLTISTAGQYYVKITDALGCFIVSNTVTATVDDFTSNVSLGPDTNLCAGNAISLKSGNEPGLSYVWNDNSTNNSLTINTSGQYSAIITNTNNCVAKDTINVNIVGQAPTASFLNSIACKNNVISFTDNSTPPVGNTISSWFWNYGDGATLADTSHFQNPNYTYADTGNFNVNLTITTNVGCKQILVKNVHVAPKPIVNFNNIIACKNDSALFTNLITTFSYPTTAYLWNFGDPLSGTANTSTLPNVKHLFSQQTIYPVKLIATNSAGCKDSITKNINVRAQVTANFTTTPACTKTDIIFQDNSIVPTPNASNIRSWNFGTSSASGLTVTKTFSIAGTYPVTLTVNGLNGCVSSITKSINVMLPPIAQFTLPSLCSKDTATALDQSIAQNGSLTSWTWKLDNTPFSSVQNPTLSPVATTAYSVKLIVVNSFSCKDSISKTFNVYPLPSVDFTTSPSTYYYPNSPIVFTPSNLSGTLYNWIINGNPYPIQSPTVVITSPGTYTASLYQKNSFGCGNTKSKTINVLSPYLDLALLETKATKSSNNYYTVEVDLANFGSTQISTFDISYQISDAGSIQETWNGTLDPGELITYQFAAKTLAKNTTDGNIVCVTIESVNTINDQNLSNNKQCVTENASSIVVSNPYPNPTDGDIILPIILNKDTEYKFELFDALGQIILEETIGKGTAGLNLVTIPTSAFRRGCYLLKITINDKTYIKKILKNSAQ